MKTETTLTTDQIDALNRVRSEMGALSNLLATSSGMDLASIGDGMASMMARWEREIGELLPI